MFYPNESEKQQKNKRYKKYLVYIVVFSLIGVLGYAAYQQVTVTWWIVVSPIEVTLEHPNSGTVLDVNTTFFTYNATNGTGNPFSYVIYYDIEVNFTSSFLRVIDAGGSTNHTPNPFPDGKWYWRVEATDGENTNVSDTWNFTVLTTPSNNFPYLTNMNIYPTTGDTDDIFTYNVTFNDPDNDTASYVNVTIDNTNYTMTEVDAGDINTTDGKNYTYTTILGFGWHNYSFSCSDGIAVNGTGNYTNPYVYYPVEKPQVTNPIPANNSENISINLVSISFNLTDGDGHTMNWTVETKPDIGTNSGINDGNGTYSCTVTGLIYNIDYTWYVNVSDQYNTTNATFYFKIQPPPFFIVSNLYPVNNSISIPIQPYIYANINHSNGSSFNYTWYYGLTLGSETIEFGNDTTVTNDTFNHLLMYATSYVTSYYLRFHMNDGTNHQNNTYTFTTVGVGGGGGSTGTAGLIGLILVFSSFGIIAFFMLDSKRKKEKKEYNRRYDYEDEYYNY